MKVTYSTTRYIIQTPASQNPTNRNPWEKPIETCHIYLDLTAEGIETLSSARVHCPSSRTPVVEMMQEPIISNTAHAQPALVT